MDKFLKDIKVRFGTFETVEYISAGLMILGGYKIWKKRNGR